MLLLASRSALSGWIRLAAALATAALLLAAPSGARADTVVSLTFDDGIASQDMARSSLAAHGMQGTFFINSGLVGSNSYYMTWPQVDALAAGGNEIGGHTVDHKRLPDLTYDQQVHEICDDAATLRNRGYAVTSFAYPFGAGVSNTAIRTIVQQCGYHDARKVGELRGPGCLDDWCVYAETVPPHDLYGIRSNEYITGPITLATLEAYVTQAEQHGGGWVPLMFHDICDACADSSVSQTDLNAFLDWLGARAVLGTTVKTMHDVIDGPVTPPPPPPPPADTTAPTTTIVCNATSCSIGWYRQAVTVSLTATDTGGSGVAVTRYTTDGTTPTETSPAFSAPFTVSEPTTINYRSWDGAGNVEAVRTATVRVDSVAPTAAITSPVNGATINTKQVTITASATDTLSGVKSVDFYVDGTKLGTDSSAPFSTGWRTQRGQHTLTAVATDTAGNRGAASAPVKVTVPK